MVAENKPDGVRAGRDGAAARDGLAANRALWDDLAEFHGTDPEDRSYDVPSFLAGGQTLRAIERELAGDVAGKDLLHLQCHFGMDTLNWARLGARVTGVDFSSKAIARARTLAEQAGVDAEFVEADTQRLPDALAGRFDLVVATYGVLSWIGDLGAWMSGAATALRPGGRLVLVDLHPAFQTVLTFDPFVADWPYGGGAPQHDAMTGTYALAEAPLEPKKSTQYPYSVGEIVTAAASAGLAVERLDEHTETETDGRHILPQGPDGLYRFPFSDTHLPILYSLSAVLPPAPETAPATGRTVRDMRYRHVDVFSPQPYSGNSLMVFPDSTDLSGKQMARITQEMRHFESVFLTQDSSGDRNWRARVFDLAEELDFAGHPLIGAACVLHALHGGDTTEIWHLKLKARTVDVTTRRRAAGRYTSVLDQGSAEFLERPHIPGLASWFSLDAEDLDPDLPPQVLSTGLRYLMIPVRGDALERARITRDLTAPLAAAGAQFAYLLDAGALEGRHWNNDGVLEDVATGSGAGCAAAYLRRYDRIGNGETVTLHQGRFTGRPSQMEISAHGEGQDIHSVTVGGDVAFVAEGVLAELPT